MRRFVRIATVSLVLVSAAVACYAKGQPVLDEASAVKVAENVLVTTYGRKQVESERPYTATLSGNVWVVYGYLPPGWVGGVAVVKIDKRNGRILSVTHTK